MNLHLLRGVFSGLIADLAGYVRGSVFRGGAATWEVYDAKTAGQILVGDGTDVRSVAVDGDATLIGVLDTRYLRLNASNDPVTAGLEINALTAAEPVLILQTTDDNAANPILEVQNAAGAMLSEITRDGYLGIGVSPTEKAEIDYGHLRFNVETAPGAPTVAVNPAAGNLNGNYRYRVTFVTVSGETEPGPASGNVAPVNQQVDLSNIPTGTANKVIARKIFRTVAGGGWPYADMYLVTTINDNTTTTYTDNVADGALGASTLWLNTSGGILYQGITPVLEASAAIVRIGAGAGAVNRAENNVFIGGNAGAANTLGRGNLFIGGDAGRSCTTGSWNLAIGAKAAYDLTTGGENCFVGPDAGRKTTTGGFNLFIGVQAGFTNTTGSSNIFVGSLAGYSCLTGHDNTCFGRLSAYDLTSGHSNVYIGTFSGQHTSIGYSNVGIGAYAARDITGGYQNIGIGQGANRKCTTGYRNIAIGHYALNDNLTGYGNIAIGYNAAFIAVGNYNIIIGYDIDPTGAAVDHELNIGALIYGKLDTKRGGVNVTSPNLLASWHVDQPVDDAAIPVLILDQADISEGFINFIGSDRGVITGATNSVGSVRAEFNGTVYRLALYADA